MKTSCFGKLLIKTIYIPNKRCQSRIQGVINESMFIEDNKRISFDIILLDICAQNMNFLLLYLNKVFNLSTCW